ncbi:MAG TPA: polyprenol phosphomannose-dependent alpha 1,6 mannosyltransferase MptB [Micromonosporaceae bacterium]|jgi:alpha-1,6-mannosyltransferase
MTPGTMVAVPRYPLIRYTGVAGAVLLAVTAFLGGALPTMHVMVTPVSIWRGEHGPLIILGWLVGTALMTAAWWAARNGVPSTRWAYLTAGLWMVPLLVAPPLGSRDVYAYACQGATVAAGQDPYRQPVAALPCQWLDSVSPIWRDVPAPYGPLFVMLAGGLVALGGSLVVTVVLLRLVAVVGITLIAVGLPALARHCGVPASRAVWLVLACPLVCVHLASGAHNDALMVGLLVSGLALVTARPTRPGLLVAGGALLGLAVSVKITAVVVLPFAAVAASTAPYRPRELARDGGWVLGAAVATAGAVTLGSGLGLGWLHGVSHSGDAVAWTSPPTAVGMTIQYAGRAFGEHLHALPATRAVAIAALAVVLLVLWWRVVRDPERSPVFGAGLALGAVIALSPAFQPWYAIWPLALLAASARRTTWFLVPAAAACFVVLADGTGLARFSKFPGALGMTALVVTVVVLAARQAWVGRGFRIGPPDRADAVRS